MFGDDQIGRGIGANRNALLLQTVGRQLLSVDDDIVGTIQHRAKASGNSSLCIRSGDPCEVSFFGSREEAIQVVNSEPLDVVAEHQAVLGARLEELVAKFSGPTGPRFEAPCQHLLRGLTAASGRVAVTFNGILGSDSATTR